MNKVEAIRLIEEAVFTNLTMKKAHENWLKEVREMALSRIAGQIRQVSHNKFKQQVEEYHNNIQIRPLTVGIPRLTPIYDTFQKLRKDLDASNRSFMSGAFPDVMLKNGIYEEKEGEDHARKSEPESPQEG